MSIKKKITIYVAIYFFIQIPLLILGKKNIIRNDSKMNKEIEIKEGTYKLYNYNNDYAYEIGFISIEKNNNDYVIFFKGDEYKDKAKYTEYEYNFNKIELNNVQLKKKNILKTDILIGKTQNYKILISREPEARLFADEIFNEYWEYYFVHVLTSEQFDTMITKGQYSKMDFNNKINHTKDCVYKACFFYDGK